MVYGVTGSGKTTATTRISAATGIPWTSVDDLTWEPGWVAVPEEEQRRKISEVCARDEWLLDTAYAQWLDVPLARVELIVALDYPRWVSLQRLLRRTLARAIDKRPICNGNTETWREMFSRDSIIAWHFRSFTRKRQRIAEWSRQARPATDPARPATDQARPATNEGGPRILRFTSPAALDQWVDSLEPVTTT